MPTFGARGEGWVLAQFALFLLWLLAPQFERPWPTELWAPVAGLGMLSAVLGAVFLARGIGDLGGSFTMYPRPKGEAPLVTRGAYARVRHPIYTGVTLLWLGLGLVSGNLARVALALVALVFFDRKAAREEQWLAEQFPDYEDYRQRVPWRLIPGIR